MFRGIRTSTALLIALALVDAGLVLALVLRHVQPVTETTGLGGAGGPADAPAHSGSSPLTQHPPSRAGWIVDALSPTTALRARTGGCAEGSAVPEITRDGGQTWRKTPTLATSVLKVKFLDESTLWFVGTERDCNPDLFSSGDGGDSWQQLASTSRTWHLLPGRGPRLHSPTGNVPSPCGGDAPLVDLTGVTTKVGYVLCADGNVHRTADGGATWQRRTAVPRGWALSFPTADTGYAAARGHRGCAGLAIFRTTDSGGSWKRRGCVGGLPADTGIALSFTENGAGTLLAGRSSWWSDDGGRTWSAGS